LERSASGVGGWGLSGFEKEVRIKVTVVDKGRTAVEASSKKEEMGPLEDFVDFDSDELAATDIWVETGVSRMPIWGSDNALEGLGLCFENVQEPEQEGQPEALFLEGFNGRRGPSGSPALPVVEDIGETVPDFLQDPYVEGGGTFGQKSRYSKPLNEASLGQDASIGAEEVSISPVEQDRPLPQHKEAAAGSRQRPKKKCLKNKGKLGTLALGEDVAIQKVVQMTKLTLVGRVNGRVFALRTISNWMKDAWSFLGYVPEVVELCRNWVAFYFHSEEQAQLILRQNWSIDGSPMLIKPWSPLFDASRERVDIIPIWVRLPALPLQFWEEEHFQSIGNLLGEFLESDKSYLDSKQRKMARILVKINVREGLGDEVDLAMGPFRHTQKIDYENVPFRCRRCHVYGHLVADCKLPLRTRNHKMAKGKQVQVQDPLSIQERGQSEPVEGAGELALREAHLEGPRVRGCDSRAYKTTRPIRKGSCMNWVHPTLPLVFPTGIPSTPCTSLSSLLQNLNLNLESNKWLESLNASHPVSNPLTLKALELEDNPPEVTPLSGLNIPDKPVLSGKGKGQLGNLVPSRYLLRSKTVLNPAGGLGLEPPVEGRGRGRKSFISKAKNKAKRDMMAGKQQSIERALRASRTQDLGSL